MEYIAHIRVTDNKIQTVEEHLLAVQQLAEQYGEKVGLKHVAGLAGMLHDLGKFTAEFRTYIWNAVYHPEKAQRRGEVDHSTAGGKLLYQLFHSDLKQPYKVVLAEIVGNAIISHHSYLQDFITPDLTSKYLARVRDKELTQFDHTVGLFFSRVMAEEEFQAYVNQAAKELEAFIEPQEFAQQSHFISKYIFSALIDADRTNTRQFAEDTDVEPEIDHKLLFQNFYNKLMAKITCYKQSEEADQPINRLRSEMSEQCEQYALRPSGVYTLSIPTGGGKTLASLRYALRHAIEYGKKRIVYIVPFTTIIEQNAAEVKKILEDDIHILEHHSNVLLDASANEKGQEGQEEEKQDGLIDQKHKLRLARDNWASPIIFTTMVQFLNVFYAKGNRNTRRLHNLSEAVLIFDEVQKVPTSCVSLFNEAVNFLKSKGQASIILCTATQPALDFVERKLQMEHKGEIIAHLPEVAKAFKRVELVDQATDLPMNNAQLLEWVEEKAKEVKSILIILNTKAVTRNLYQGLDKSNRAVFHLSTTMCAAHRNHVLQELKGLLAEKKPVICVSTQLIEAGVDVSFECVVRSLAGLDSIAQAAGRCNRHGERPTQKVYVIDHAEENLDQLKEIKKGKEITRQILRDLTLNPKEYGGDLLSAEAMSRYFKEFYTDFKAELNYFIKDLKVNMTDLLLVAKRESEYANAYPFQNKGQALPLVLANSYQTAADHFHVIADATIPVLVPYQAGREIIAELNGDEWINDLSGLLRQAQHYSVNLFTHEMKALEKQDALVSLLDGQVLALKEGWYSEEYGIDLKGDSGFGLLTF